MQLNETAVSKGKLRLIAQPIAPVRAEMSSRRLCEVLGEVLGISINAVTPPFAAAMDPVRRSSLCVRPGSRK